MIDAPIAFVVGAALSLAGSALIVGSARLSALAEVAPVADRWHRRTVPGLGGAAMFAPFALVAGLGAAAGETGAAGLLAGASILFAVGLVDDLRGLGARAKLGAQALAALTVTGLWSVGTGADGGGVAHHPLLGALWIVVVANGTNLLDNMDGLAAGVALAAVAGVLALSGIEVPGMPVAAYAALAGALVGFLALNAHPAKLFMGDSGSQWLGLAVGAGGLACMTEVQAPLHGSPLAWLVPLLVCAVPLADTATVIVTRRRRGHPVWRGGRDHLSHRLVRAGMGERGAVALLWAWAAGGVAVAAAVVHLPVALWLPLALLFASALALFAARLARVAPA